MREYGGSNMEILVANGQMNGRQNRPSIDLVYLPRVDFEAESARDGSSDEVNG